MLMDGLSDQPLRSTTPENDATKVEKWSQINYGRA